MSFEMNVPVTNRTMELSDCKDAWTFDEKHHVWCLEDIIYTPCPTTPKFQRLSIFVPEEYMKSGTVLHDGVNGIYTADTAPIIFSNNSAGYMQMPHTWLDGPRCSAMKYLPDGMIYVTCGNRGSDSKDSDGKWCGKSPINLVDLKTGIRFLRHNHNVLPGDFSRIISDGWSAGGAMSTLLAVTGNSKNYDELLKQNGAFMDEKDDIYAAQIYCPITDLDHADEAYEWMFHNDPENEDSPAGPHSVMTTFLKALSAKLKDQYVSYFNSLDLKDPITGNQFVFGKDGRSGTAYDFLMKKLSDSATVYLNRIAEHKLPVEYTVADYLSGSYKFLTPAPMPKKDRNPMQGHAGPGVDLPPMGIKEMEPLTLGDLMSRPPVGMKKPKFELPMMEKQGNDKLAWLKWDGTEAVITDLDTYVLNQRRRMKPCTAFDSLNCRSGENRVFGSPEKNEMHFDADMVTALESLKDEFPEEYAMYMPEYKAVIGDEALARRKYLINPMNYIDTPEQADQAKHYRIRVGASDADTAFSVGMLLYVKLLNAGFDANYELVFEQVHSEADYEGEAAEWIKQL